MKNSPVIQIKTFADIDLSDPFFDSLKQAYHNFSGWFEKKKSETAYVSYNKSNNLQAFLYLKTETGPVTDIDPPLKEPACLKVGTFKIDAHGTRFGERFIKIIMDQLLKNSLRTAYITIFPKHSPLINILKKFGFIKYGLKHGSDGMEEVYVKNLSALTGERQKDYPLIDCRDCNKWIMGIYPRYHTHLFPDSKLNNEQATLIEDKDYTNGIYKIYVGAYSNFCQCSPGDAVIIYRTGDKKSAARFRAVITSVCIIEEVKKATDFGSFANFKKYCHTHSVFGVSELYTRYKRQYQRLYAIKMTYNITLAKE